MIFLFKELQGGDSIQSVAPSSTGLGKEGFVEGTGSFHCTSFVSSVFKQLPIVVVLKCTRKSTSPSGIGMEMPWNVSNSNFEQNNRYEYGWFCLRGSTKHRLACQALTAIKPCVCGFGAAVLPLVLKNNQRGLISAKSWSTMVCPVNSNSAARKQRAAFYRYHFY